ncbi:MAG TPA: hypothetical protein VJZ16_05170 [Syntrophales bacterium]|nr:hypothetical protein [Syntrophales bacterium]
MQKLTKREIIILGVMAMAILYGAFNFFVFAPAGKTSSSPSSFSWKNPSELKTFAADMSVGMGKDTLSVEEVYAIGRAEGEWLRDPFYERNVHRGLFKDTAKTEGDAKKITFHYTGYMKHQGREIAIINGWEYGPGDVLETQGYSLKKIYPDKVIIENKEYQVKTEVPMQD